MILRNYDRKRHGINLSSPVKVSDSRLFQNFTGAAEGITEKKKTLINFKKA
jgi:hypothetical protein